MAALLAIGAALPPAVRAQAAAEQQRSYAFNIPAKPITEALNDIARITGLSVVFTTEVPRTAMGRPVSGSLTARQALTAMLQGSGYTYSFTAGDTVTLLSAPQAAGSADGGVSVPEVNVEAAPLRGWSPVRGFVAGVSSAGTRTDTPLIETPQSISVVTRDQMDAQGVLSVPQALRYTAGVLPEYRGAASRNDLIYSRGFGGLTNVEYLDGLRLLTGSFSYPQIDQYNLERLEVLRGPASVLYGQNVPGGLVNLVSRRPPSQPYHEVRLEAGSNRRFQGAFDFGGPIDAEGQFLYRLTGLMRDSDTQVDFAREQRASISPALTWRPNSDTSLTILANYQHDPKSGYYGFLPAVGTVFRAPYGRLPTSFFDGDPNYDRFERYQYSIGYLFEHRFDETWTVRQNFRYMHIDSDYRSVFGQGVQANQVILNRSAQDSVESLDGITIDTQVEARFATGPLSHTLLVGVDYQRSVLDQVRHSGVVTPLDLRRPVYGIAVNPPLFQSIRVPQNQTGLYVQDQIRLGRLVLTGGLRWDWVDSATENRLTRRTTKTTADALTGRIGLVYLFDSGLAPYVSYSTSFQPVTGTDFSGNAFEPTSGRQYEIGIKYQPPGVNSFITLAVFDLVQRNVSTVDTAHPGFTVQTGETRVRGIELEGRASLTDNLNLIATYTYLDDKITRANDATRGNRPTLIPTHTAALWADYTFRDGPLSGLRLGGGIRYVGPTAGDAANTFRVPGYTVGDAVIGYDFGALTESMRGLQGTINLTNLTDQRYVSGCTYAGGCYWGLRRSVLASLSYRW